VKTQIRAATSDDIDALRRVNLAAFEGTAEADLVAGLSVEARPLVSLLAEAAAGVVGHILFSPARLDADPAFAAMALAPMAVLPDCQRRGIGGRLVEAGLAACREAGCQAVFVLGHADYYPRFGFVPAARFGIHSRYEVPEEYFMALELLPGALDGKAGLMRYHAAFDALDES